MTKTVISMLKGIASEAKSSKRKAFSLLNLALFFILISGFLIRINGIGFGLPQIFHPDEPSLVNRAFKMVSSGDLNPRFFNYPTFLIYIDFFFFNIESMFLNEPSQSLHYLTARFFVACLGTATIYITFLISKKLYNKKVGVISSFFLAFMPLAVQDSHYATVDVPVTFFIALAFYSILYVAEYGKMKYYLISGFLIGLAASIKYNGGLLVIPLLAAVLIENYKQSGKNHMPKSETENFSWKEEMFLNDINKLFYAGIMSLSGFLLTSPYIILDFNSFLRDLTFEMNHMKIGHGVSFLDTSPAFVYHITNSLKKGMTVPLEAISILGVTYIILKIIFSIKSINQSNHGSFSEDVSKKELFSGIMLMSWILPYYLIIGSWEVKFVRYVIPILPLLSICAAYFIYKFSSWSCEELQKRGSIFSKVRTFDAILIVSVFLLMVSPIQASITLDQTFYIHDTRETSFDWIDQNLPPNSLIIREQYTPQIELLNKFKVIYKGNSLFRTNLTELSGSDYLIISSSMYRRYYNHPENSKQELAFYRGLDKNFQLVKEFKPEETSKGPVIKIYSLKPEKSKPNSVRVRNEIT